MTEQASMNAPQVSEIIFSFYRFSPLFSVLISISIGIMVYLLIHKIKRPESVKFKIVSLEFNQLTLSTILFLASITGYIVRRATSIKFAIFSFVFIFIFLAIVSLMYKSTERR